MLGDDDAECPILGKRTTGTDFDEAQFVMNSEPCTLLDLECFCLFDGGWVDDAFDDKDEYD